MSMSSVEEFRRLYLVSCDEQNIDPSNGVLDALKESHLSSSLDGYCVNFGATHNWSTSLCSCIAVCLRKDRTFREIHFSDCMIPEEGMKKIIHALCENDYCQFLNLKGNNIRGKCCELLGKLLKTTKTLINLQLEWNQLGVVDTSFAVFCDGLSVCQSLQILDVRNNQLSHETGKQLAHALKKNRVLKLLDLRWNNLGLLGGRELLNSLHINKSIQTIDLTGNNIPNDVVKAIENSVEHNREKEQMLDQMKTETDHLSKRINDKEELRKVEMEKWITKLGEKESHLRLSNNTTISKISQLQELLTEKKQAYNQVSSKLTMVQSKLEVAESRISELEKMVDSLETEKQSATKQHQSELKREKDNHLQYETKMIKREQELQEQIATLSMQLEDAQRNQKSQKEQIYDLREQVTHLQADIKLRQSQLDEKLHHEKQKFRDEIRDLEESKQKEVARVRQENEYTERSYKERLHRLETHKTDLEEELARMKNQMTSEKLSLEEQLMNVRQKVREEEEQRIQKLDEKIRLLKLGKDELQSQNSHMGSTVSDLQSKNSNLQIEIESLKRKIEDLQQELGGKNAEIQTEVGKVRVEWQQRLNRLEAERQSQEELYNKVDKLESQLSDLKTKHASELVERDRELVQLRDRLYQRDLEIQRLQQEEAQRMNNLKTAVLQYCNGAGGAAPVPGFGCDPLSRGAPSDH